MVWGSGGSGPVSKSYDKIFFNKGRKLIIGSKIGKCSQGGVKKLAAPYFLTQINSIK